MRIADYAQVYSGIDPCAAKSAHVNGTHAVAAESMGEAMRQCAFDVGYIKRGLKPLYGTTKPLA